MGTGRPGHGGRARRFHRWGQNQVLYGEFHQRAEFLQQSSASFSPQLCPGRFRFVLARRSCAVYLERLPDAGSCDLDDGCVVRRLSRGEFAVQASGRDQAVLRDVRRLRFAEFHGRVVRRQFLFQQSHRLSLEHERSVVLRADCELRYSHHYRHGAVGEQRTDLPALRSSF